MEKIFKITLHGNKKYNATDVVKWAHCGGVEITATDITSQSEVNSKEEKIFKLILPENQDCRAEIIVAWAKLDDKSITASDITSNYGPKGQQTTEATGDTTAGTVQITTEGDTTSVTTKKSKVTKKGKYAEADKD